MNAYELADAIEDWDSDGQWDKPAADMLREQADRIAELERLVSDMIYEKSSGVYQGKYLEQYWVKQQSVEPAKAQQAINPAPTLEEIIKWQVDRIAELEKELSVWRNARVPDEIMESTRKSILSMVNTRIAELEQEVVMYRTDAERLTMRIIDFSVSPQTKKLSDEEQEACFNRGYKEGAKDYASKSPQIKELSDEEIDDFTVRIYNCRTGAEAHEIVLAILKKAIEK